MKIFFFAILTTLFIVSFGKAPNVLKPWEKFAEQKGQNINPRDVIWEDDHPWIFGKRRQLYQAFRVWPLAVIVDNDLRYEMSLAIDRQANPDEARKRVALAAYFSMMNRENLFYALENLDTHLKRYYAYTGRDVSVTEAYYDIARMLHPDEFFFYEEYGPVILRISAWICLPTTACLLLWFLIKRRKTIKNWIVQKMKTTSPFLLCSLILTELLLAVAVVAAFLPGGTKLDNGFYTFLRIAVCGTSAWLAWISRTGRPVLCFFLAAFAALFNPLIPIHFGDRDVWSIFDLAAIPLLLCSTFLTKKDSR